MESESPVAPSDPVPVKKQKLREKYISFHVLDLKNRRNIPVQKDVIVAQMMNR